MTKVYIVKEYLNDYDSDCTILAVFKNKPSDEDIKKETGYNYIGYKPGCYAWMEVDSYDVIDNAPN